MKCILIAEDYDDLMNIVAYVLKDEGYDVKKSWNAEQAIRLCESSPPDLIISDVDMVGMDGFELLQKLKASEVWKNIPFIFLTAVDAPEDKRKGLALGARAYITKPFDVDDLLTTVMKLVPPK